MTAGSVGLASAAAAPEAAGAGRPGSTAGGAPEASPKAPEFDKAKHYPQWGMRISAVVVLILFSSIAYMVFTNQNLQWSVVFSYLFNAAILEGVWGTLELTFGSLVITIISGFLVAYMGQGNQVMRMVSHLYIWWFRGVPLLVQLLFWFNIALLFPKIWAGVPFTDLGQSIKTNDIVSATTAALLGLGLHEGAYMAEIVRSGIISVPEGQTEAALTMGMTRSQALRRIVFPQMIRVIIPPTGNLAISLLKASSLVAAIGGGELLSTAAFIYGQNFAVIPLLIVATVWYLVLVSIATILQRLVEQKLTRSRPERSLRDKEGPAQ